MAVGWDVTPRAESEPGEDVVHSILDRRDTDGMYLTRMEDGSEQYLRGDAFISDDGTINATFLKFVRRKHLKKLLLDKTQNSLSTLCMAPSRSW